MRKAPFFLSSLLLIMLTPLLLSIAQEIPMQTAQVVVDEREKERILAREKKAELNNTRWQIVLSAVSGETNKYPKTDTLTFSNNKIASEQFGALGYPATNYTVRIDPDGTVVWETMKTKPGEGVIFFRGERRDKKFMQGSITIKPEKGGESTSFNFISKRFERLEVAAPVQQEAAGVASATPEVQSQKAKPAVLEAGKKTEDSKIEKEKSTTQEKAEQKKEQPKKKGWFR